MSDDDDNKDENAQDEKRGNGSAGGAWDDSNVAMFPDEKTRKAREAERKQALADEKAMRKKQEKIVRKLAEQAAWRGDGAEISKDEPMINLPKVTKLLLTVIVMVHLGTWVLSDQDAYAFISYMAFVPGRYTGAVPFSWEAVVSLVGHMFVHGGWLHLAMNVLMLMAFGSGLEREIGAKRMLVLFFATGMLGALTHMLFYFGDMIPMVGASGGISGLFGALLVMLQDKGHIQGGMKKLMPLIVLWIVIMIGFGMLGAPGTGQPVAWTTHVGGFVAGIVLYPYVLRMKI